MLFPAVMAVTVESAVLVGKAAMAAAAVEAAGTVCSSVAVAIVAAEVLAESPVPATFAGLSESHS